MKKSLLTSLLLTSSLLAPCIGSAETISQREAFPGAEGYGRMTTGGRGGAVYHVTTLEDNSEPGSFRYAVEKSGTRTIVFDVSGTIRLQKELKLTNGNVTIAGQTAPGDGICIADFPFTISTNNVIIRFMRFRLGSEKLTEEMANSGAADGWDGLGAIDKKDIIVDHCSVSWSIDECLSFVGCENTTVQWCIVSQSMVKGHSKLKHGYGGNWGGAKASYHHNLMAHHTSRTPRLGPRYTTQERELMDMRNNVLFNYSGESCYGGEAMKVNIVNNYYQPGPGNKYVNATGSTAYKATRIAGIGIRNNDYIKNYPVYKPTLHVVGSYYVTGNKNSAKPQVEADNWETGIYNQIDWSEWDDVAGTADKRQAVKNDMRLDTPLEFLYTTTHTPDQAYNKVLEYAGASLSRDELDKIIINDARTNTAKFTGSGLDKGFINSTNDIKLSNGTAWPTLTSKPAEKDTDGDGMPDAWETANGLDPNDANDGKALAKDGFTNLEHYMNSLVEEIMTKGNEGGKLLTANLEYSDAAVELPEYVPSVNPGNDGTKIDGNKYIRTSAEDFTNNTMCFDNFTAEFLDNSSKDGTGEWDFSKKTYIAGNQNGQQIKFTTITPGTLKIYFGGDLADNKSLNMFVNGDATITLDAKDSNGVVLKSGLNLKDMTPPHAAIANEDYIEYELQAGKTYNFYAGGTKYRIGGFEFIPGAESGIEDIITDVEAETGNGKIYNLMGIEVKGNLAPGIYIRDGKKFLVK